MENPKLPYTHYNYKITAAFLNRHNSPHQRASVTRLRVEWFLEINPRYANCSKMYALETTETLCRPAADNDLSGGFHVRMAVDVWYLCARAVCLFACVWMCFHECVCACVCNPLNQSEIAINRPVFTLVRTYTNPCKCQRYFSVFKCRPRLRLLVLSERIVHVQSAHRRGVCVCAQPKIVKFM